MFGTIFFVILKTYILLLSLLLYRSIYLQPEHYGLSEEFSGCKPCDCVIGGAYDNNCDVISGQCKCRPNFSGRRCDTADSSFYCPSIDHYTYEAENANITRV